MLCGLTLVALLGRAAPLRTWLSSGIRHIVERSDGTDAGRGSACRVALRGARSTGIATRAVNSSAADPDAMSPFWDEGCRPQPSAPAKEVRLRRSRRQRTGETSLQRRW